MARERAAAGIGAVAGPAVVVRTFNHPGANRIQVAVSE
jgi:hypothetical protein